jgi:hypothetical protein
MADDRLDKVGFDCEYEPKQYGLNPLLARCLYDQYDHSLMPWMSIY